MDAKTSTTLRDEVRSKFKAWYQDFRTRKVQLSTPSDPMFWPTGIQPEISGTQTLGKGGHSTVMKARHSNGQALAVKVLRDPGIDEHEGCENELFSLLADELIDLQQEIEARQNLSHANIIKCVGVIAYNGFASGFFMERLEILESLIEKPVPDAVVLGMMKQIINDWRTSTSAEYTMAM